MTQSLKVWDSTGCSEAMLMDMSQNSAVWAYWKGAKRYGEGTERYGKFHCVKMMVLVIHHVEIG